MDPLIARSMQEVPLGDQTAALAFADRLVSGDYEWLILMTGVGFRMLFDAALTRYSEEVLVKSMARNPIACRGPKPVAVLKKLGLSAAVVAPEPNTYRELIRALDECGTLSGQRVVLQEYGVENPEFDKALLDRGALLEKVPVYAWTLPDDLGPLRGAIGELVEGAADGIIFTSQQQWIHLEQVAMQMGCLPALVDALKTRALVASIGPMTTDALERKGLAVDIEPAHPKMGHLTKALREFAVSTLAEKRDKFRR